MNLYIPDGTEEQQALQRTTHLAIAAHQDDIEIMSYHGILQCFEQADRHFTGVVVTNGSGSPRSGIYANYSDDEMQRVRKTEQKRAAAAGGYSAQVFMDYPSSQVKNATDQNVVEEIKELIQKTTPQVIYTHNLADKHDTHVAVAARVVQALRELGYLPEKFYGCEVWRGLDWMNDKEKIPLNVSGRDHLEAAVLGVFDSQIAGGKRYDLAAVGRRLANATFSESHGVDAAEKLIYAMDLSPLLANPALKLADFAVSHIQNFAQDVAKKIGGIL